MKCPHCLENFNGQQTWWSVALGDDVDASWLLKRWHCPSCRHFIFHLAKGTWPAPTTEGQVRHTLNEVAHIQVWPKGISRAPMPKEVPPAIAEDYKEACLVLADSPKASAALSRRCLQNILRQHAGVKHSNLDNEIQQVIDAKQVPSHISDELDSVRIIGNFGAHPIKSQSTGEIVEVEPHEAGWNLDVLESLFDFYFVLPSKAQAKKDALNKKLADANKPPLK